MTKTFGKSAASAVVYICFAIYLYQPHFSTFKKLQFLILVNVCLASLGCFVLSRRWVPGFLGQLFAGATYGFGPFMLGLAGYHPSVGFLSAMIPWLFSPAVFGPKGKWQWLRVPLAILPFSAILLFFWHIFSLPAVCSTDAKSAAFGRPCRSCRPLRCDPTGVNSGRVLSCPRSCTCDGVRDALRRPSA